MRSGMKKALCVALTLMTTATVAATAYATDYNRASVSASNDEVKEAVSEAVAAEAGGTATVEVKSTTSIPVSSSVIKELAKSEDSVLEIVSPKATFKIEAATVKKVKRVDLSAKVYSSTKRAVVDFYRAKGDFGCEVKVYLTNCKMSAKALANAKVYCDDEEVGSVQFDDNNVPYFIATKGGKYEVKA